jgi:hypothetical protein
VQANSVIAYAYDTEATMLVYNNVPVNLASATFWFDDFFLLLQPQKKKKREEKRREEKRREELKKKSLYVS